MSELSNLVGVLGAVDDHVVEHPELVADVARLLCPYRYGALGWFPAFKEWLAARPDAGDEPQIEIVGLDAALGGLADTSDIERGSEDPGLRLLAIAVLGRVITDYGPRGTNADRTAQALAIPELASDGGAQAHRLLELLTNTERYPDAAAWDQMMSQAVADQLIAADSAAPLRCQGEVVQVTVAGHSRPATAITTSLTADDVTFADATAVLDPSEWPHCCPAWCSMTRGTDGPNHLARYEEVIGLACPTPILKTCLSFRNIATPKLAGVAYKLTSPTQPDCPSDGEVLVDEGSITVRDRSPAAGVSVTTTKRVLFKSVQPGPLAMFSCVFGYGDMGRLMVYGCARRHANRNAKAAKKGPKAPKRKKFKGTDLPAGSDDPRAEIIGEVSTMAKDCVSDSAARFRTNLEAAATGTYSSDDAAADLSGMVQRASADFAKTIDLGRRMVDAARGAAPETAAETATATATEESSS